MKFDFGTWLVQTYGLKEHDLTKRELSLARKEYKEEYPRPGNGPIVPKTYPFQKYLNSKKKS